MTVVAELNEVREACRRLRIANSVLARTKREYRRVVTGNGIVHYEARVGRRLVTRTFIELRDLLGADTRIRLSWGYPVAVFEHGAILLNDTSDRIWTDEQ